jgi:ribosome biogenesis GTPase A
MTVLTKQSAYTLLNLKSVEELNGALTELANHLQSQGKEVPAEIAHPTAQMSISKAHLTLLRDYRSGKLEIAALPQAQENNGNNSSYERVEESAALAVTDDDILDVAASTGVNLDVVMNAAAHVADLEALVKWVEVYKELEDEQAIRDSAKEQFEIDQLRKKESQLGERLTTALNKTPINTALIRERLGVAVSESITKLGNWDGKVDSKDAPDFLKSARAKVAQAGIGQN